MPDPPAPPDHVAEPQAAYNTGRRPATYQDVLDAPSHKVAEILDGELVLSPRPAWPHTHAASVMGADVLGPFHRRPGGPRGPGGWWILDEPELHLGSQVLVPDLAGWRRERMPVFPRAPFSTLAPDWVCEVLSPSTCRVDRVLKTRIYSEHEVSWLWMVDPLARVLEVFELRDGYWSLVQVFEGSDVVRAKPFDAVELEMERWWVPEVQEAEGPQSAEQGQGAPEGAGP